MLTVEASEGLREHAQRVSAVRTVTRGTVICDDCFVLPELAIIRKILTHPYTENDLHGGRNCFTLCRYPRRRWFDRLLYRGEEARVKRGRVRCPGCGRYGHCWSVDRAPLRVKWEADDVVLGPQGPAALDQGEPAESDAVAAEAREQRKIWQ